MSDTASTVTIDAALWASIQDMMARSQEQFVQLQHAYERVQQSVALINTDLECKNIELQQSLRAQEEIRTYLASILQSMNNGVVAVDIMGGITHFNRAAADLYGYSADEVLGRPYAEVFVREAESPHALVRVLHMGKAHPRDEKTLWRKDGQPLPVSFQTALLRDMQDHTLGAVEIFEDISRIKALEQEMQHNRTLAALGEMSSVVAHEIRNPLGAMGVWVGLLERDLKTGDPGKDICRRLHEGLGRLNRIVSNLLLYTRPIKAQLHKIGLVQLLEETINFVAVEIEQNHSAVIVCKQWHVQVEEVFISVDPERVQQVIMNLSQNAVQAMPAGGTLTISIEPPHQNGKGDFVAFTIQDTGCGIAADQIDKIFDPFFTTKENGTGLGLAIVKRIVEFHSGFLDVKSQAGIGTAMTVFLPLYKG